jgi:transposase
MSSGFLHPIERVGCETGAMSQHLFFGLTAEGFDVVCMKARQVSAALSAMRNKTDKTDARGIAQILRTGWFSPVHMKSRKSHGLSKAGDRDVRAVLYAAANALLMRTMASSQIKSWGTRLMRTKGRRRAVVAVARKLAILMHRMWIDGSEFRPDQVGGMA